MMALSDFDVPHLTRAGRTKTSSLPEARFDATDAIGKALSSAIAPLIPEQSIPVSLPQRVRVRMQPQREGQQ
jgi:hypothetical protein